ncbi:GlcG/HbpS family heme-binding protein [Marivita sp.]|uniref:GlcG/HbpS family heme-binding protein n=1 Tax=Marivita sp. TaxID=2003365 RepID=UPI003F6BE2A0
MANLSLRRARTIIRKTLDAGREAELKPLAVIVLDAGGNVQAFEREDGASPGRFQIAHGKAYGTVMLGMAGTAQKGRAEEQAYFITSAGAALGGQMVPVPGGVLVRDAKGKVLGAVGVSGDVSDNDAAVAKAGIEAVGLTAEI